MIDELPDGVTLLCGKNTLEQINRCKRIVERSVAARNTDSEVLFQVAQAVTGQSGKNLSGEPDRTKLFPGLGKTQPRKLFADKTIIK